MVIKWRKVHKPDGGDEALYGVGHGARVTCQDGPRRWVFRVEDKRASTFQQLGGAVQHRTSRAQDWLLSRRALERKGKNNKNNQKIILLHHASPHTSPGQLLTKLESHLG